MIFSRLLRATAPLTVVGVVSLAAASCSSKTDDTVKSPNETFVGRAEVPDTLLTRDAEKVRSEFSFQEVAQFEGPELVGVAALPTGGRLFVSFPRWGNNPIYPVAELGPNSTLKPYPDAGWCLWNDSVRNEPGKHWICPQAVVADKKGFLWVVDPAAPGLDYAIAGGSKLVKIDPKTNRVVQNIVFDRELTPKHSYLNDVRIDTDRNVAYLTDSGLGALVVVDLNTGKARQLLRNHPSTKAEPGVVLTVEGHKMLDNQGKPMQLHADGIALSPDNQYLYYHVVTGYTLYRIKTAALRNAALSEAQLARQVENLGKTPATDGMIMDQQNNLYLTAIEDNSLVRRTPAGQLETLVKSNRLQWPDTYSYLPDGTLYVTTSQIHNMPVTNQGVSRQQGPFRLFKLAPEQ